MAKLQLWILAFDSSLKFKGTVSRLRLSQCSKSEGEERNEFMISSIWGFHEMPCSRVVLVEDWRLEL